MHPDAPKRNYEPNSTFSIPKVFTKKAHLSAASSIIFVVGLPAPCPAFVSILINTGASPL